MTKLKFMALVFISLMAGDSWGEAVFYSNERVYVKGKQK